MRRISPGLLSAALAISALAAIPLLYIVVRALGADPAVWERLWLGQVRRLLGTTALLLLATLAVTIVLGVGLAWAIERTNLPGRRTWRWLMALPLAVPAYVGAVAYVGLLGRGGLIEPIWRALSGAAKSVPFPAPNLYSVGGAALIIGLLVYPYVYLPVSAALRSSNRTLEEAAQMAGSSPARIFWRVTLPLITPNMLAGALLVALYVLSDFGTVGILRVYTFTSAIFSAFSGSADRAAAAILSGMLLALTVPILLGESAMARRAQLFVPASAWKPQRPLDLGRWKWLALGLVALVGACALGVPIFVFSVLTLRQWLRPTATDRLYGYGDTLGEWALNTVLLSGLTATVAVFLAIAPAYLSVRAPGRLSRIVMGLCKIPFALPGLLIGLSIVFIFNTPLLNLAYGTLFALACGFVIRLLPHSVTNCEVALRAAPPTLEQAARTLGQNQMRTLWRVVLPVAAPGLMATWCVAFVTAMKELPTVLLLRPPGFDTLPVRVWSAAREAVWAQAALPALLLIGITALPLFLLYNRGRLGLARVLSE
jgi:iron(III) transport system permease protein